MTPNNLSRLEDPDYGKHTLRSLKRIAEALDVGLVVRFVPFSQYIDWLSGTPYMDEGLRPNALAVPSFREEEERGAFARVTMQTLPTIITPTVAGEVSVIQMTPFKLVSGVTESAQAFQREIAS